MLPLFRWGLGGRIGTGKQWMSWISLTDEVAAIRLVLEDESFSGPVNLTAPNPVTNAELTQKLGRALGRPTLLPVPMWAIKTLLGEMGEVLLLGSQWVKPGRLMEKGFKFRATTLEEAFRLEGVDKDN
jgi:uncharacterized protein (TIGR01777 family)